MYFILDRKTSGMEEYAKNIGEQKSDSCNKNSLY